MAQTVRISSLEVDGLGPYRTLKRPQDHVREGIFVAEGSKVVERLLDSGLTLESLLLTPEWHAELQIRIAGLSKDPVVYVGEKQLLERIVGFNLHQGIMAVARIPSPVSLDELLQYSPRPYFLVAIDGLTNAENLGVLVRNSVAFGVHALIVGETSSSPYLRRAVRNSMGAIFKLPVVHVDNLRQTLLTLSNTHGILTIAAHPHADQSALHESSLQRDTCIVFGSEGSGVSSAVLETCNVAVAIRMCNDVDSLNVASASAVFLYEVYRQRIGSRG
ncbi:MAG: RNA methyltransferase [Ignavibacteria bacterium]|nr:RNA methyltransferase [Ignavibacteria bacterium]